MGLFDGMNLGNLQGLLPFGGTSAGGQAPAGGPIGKDMLFKGSFASNASGFASNAKSAFGAMGGATGVAGLAANIASGAINKIAKNNGYDKDGDNAKTDNIEDKALNAAMMIPGVNIGAMAAKVGVAISRATDTQVDALSQKKAQSLGYSRGQTKLMNAGKILANLTGMNFLNKAINGEVRDAKSLDTYGQAVQAGYGGTADMMEAADSMSGKNYLGGAVSRGNKLVAEANLQASKQDAAGRIAFNRTNANNISDLLSQSNIRYMGGNGNYYAGKMGMKILDEERVNTILASLSASKTQVFQAGGVIGIDSSLLPEGALHKELNHMDKVNPKVDDVITEKGIPIVAVGEDGSMEQIAEVEKEELLLTKVLTDKLEELLKKGDEEAMIEAGKLIAEELITNTQDNTGQLEELQQYDTNDGDSEGKGER